MQTVDYNSSIFLLLPYRQIYTLPIVQVKISENHKILFNPILSFHQSRPNNLTDIRTAQWDWRTRESFCQSVSLYLSLVLFFLFLSFSLSLFLALSNYQSLYFPLQFSVILLTVSSSSFLSFLPSQTHTYLYFGCSFLLLEFHQGSQNKYLPILLQDVWLVLPIMRG